MVDAHLFLLKNPKADYGIFNIGSGINTKVIEVAEYIAFQFKAKVSTSGSKRINTARNQIMNISKLVNLGWRPKYTWQNAVDDYIKAGD